MAKRPPAPVPAVAGILAKKSPAARKALTALRRLVYETAAATEGVGALEETLKWGEPSYLTPETGSGTTVRIDTVKHDPSRVAIFVNCQTDLLARYRDLYPNLDFEGDRAVRFPVGKPLPEEEIRHIVGLALTYHRSKRGGR